MERSRTKQHGRKLFQARSFWSSCGIPTLAKTATGGQGLIGHTQICMLQTSAQFAVHAISCDTLDRGGRGKNPSWVTDHKDFASE
eukprot:8054550-Karenia_brevis.AAC.1